MEEIKIVIPLNCKDEYRGLDSPITIAKRDAPEILCRAYQEQILKLGNLIKKTKNKMNMEKLNLVEKLKNAPKGLKLYSPLVGDVTFVEVLESSNYPISVDGIDGNYRFASNGRYCNLNCGECMLFPSNNCRDWNKFEIPKVGDVIEDYIKRKWEVTVLDNNKFTAYHSGTPAFSKNFHYTDDFKIIEEPKFKVGDVVFVNKNELRKIINIDAMGYLTELVFSDFGRMQRHYKNDEIRLATKEELRDEYCLMLQDGELVRWMPETGEYYFYITTSAMVSSSVNQCKIFDITALKNSNCFPTKEIAEKAAKEMTENFKNFNPNK